MGTVDTQKMAEGKRATEARTAWLVDAGAYRFRCLLEPAGYYSVQARLATGAWTEFGRGKDAAVLLANTVRPQRVVDQLNRLRPSASFLQTKAGGA